MRARHSWYPERRSRDKAPYRTPVKIKGDPIYVREDHKKFSYYDCDGEKVWEGFVNERGNVIENKLLDITFFFRPSSLRGVYLKTTTGLWIMCEDYVRNQAEINKERGKVNVLDYKYNGFIYNIEESVKRHPWNAENNRKKGTGLWFPKSVIRFDDYEFRAWIEGCGN